MAERFSISRHCSLTPSRGSHLRASTLWPEWRPELERFFEANYCLIGRSALDWFSSRRGCFDAANVYVSKWVRSMNTRRGATPSLSGSRLALRAMAQSGNQLRAFVRGHVHVFSAI
jgi:hypothetical protein